jgi:hypothetical protein
LPSSTGSATRTFRWVIRDSFLFLRDASVVIPLEADQPHFFSGLDTLIYPFSPSAESVEVVGEKDILKAQNRMFFKLSLELIESQLRKREVEIMNEKSIAENIGKKRVRPDESVIRNYNEQISDLNKKIKVLRDKLNTEYSQYFTSGGGVSTHSIRDGEILLVIYNKTKKKYYICSYEKVFKYWLKLLNQYKQVSTVKSLPNIKLVTNGWSGHSSSVKKSSTKFEAPIFKATYLQDNWMNTPTEAPAAAAAGGKSIRKNKHKVTRKKNKHKVTRRKNKHKVTRRKTSKITSKNKKTRRR